MIQGSPLFESLLREPVREPPPFLLAHKTGIFLNTWGAQSISGGTEGYPQNPHRAPGDKGREPKSGVPQHTSRLRSDPRLDRWVCPPQVAEQWLQSSLGCIILLVAKSASCTTLKPWLRPLFVGIHKGIIILRWFRFRPSTVGLLEEHTEEPPAV